MPVQSIPTQSKSVTACYHPILQCNTLWQSMPLLKWWHKTLGAACGDDTTTQCQGNTSCLWAIQHPAHLEPQTCSKPGGSVIWHTDSRLQTLNMHAAAPLEAALAGLPRSLAAGHACRTLLQARVGWSCAPCSTATAAWGRPWPPEGAPLPLAALAWQPCWCWPGQAWRVPLLLLLALQAWWVPLLLLVLQAALLRAWWGRR